MIDPKSKIQNPKSFDVIIIGGGPAGLLAAAWCDELGLKAVLIESGAELGGQLLRVFNPISNHLGAAPAATGRHLRDVLIEQIEKRSFTIQLNSEVLDLDLQTKKVFLQDEVLSARALILATGVRRRKLNVEGEAEFKDRGIIESGKGEQNSLAEKRVGVIGGGDAALENALILAETAAAVFLIHRRHDFRARKEFIEKVLADKKIKVFTETVVTKITGSKKLEAIELKNTQSGEILSLPIEALLARIGVEPNTEMFRGKLNLDDNGYLEINSDCETNVENVFAIGDVANPRSPTISSAVGMGATAAKVIFEKLNS